MGLFRTDDEDREPSKRSATASEMADVGFTLGLIAQNIPFMEEVIAEHQNGERDAGCVTVYLNDALLFVLAMQRFQRDLLNGNVPADELLHAGEPAERIVVGEYE